MINFTNRRRNANFGAFGEEGDAVDAGDSGGGEFTDEDTGAKEKKSESGGLLNSLLGVAGGPGGLMGGAGGLCGCANKDKDAENAKKKELAAKYPLRDCGPSPTQECTSYNQKMLALQQQELDMWNQNKDAQVAQALAPDDKQKFGFVAELAKKLKAAHPEAGSMTLAQIYKTYPDDFDKIYEQLKTQYPFLKNIDPQTALAMAPGVASMTLDQLIAKTTAISGGAMGSASGASSSGAAMGIGVLAAAGIGLLLLLKRRD